MPHDYGKIGYQLNINGRYYNSLDIEAFSLMMKNPSYCYKFYWLEAIVHLISEGLKESNFNDIIDEMIANAWYTVLEFHIHLSGVIEGQIKDGLERAILTLQELSQLPGNASKIEIKNKIKQHDKELAIYKDQLTHMVPYRALSGFFDKCNERADWSSTQRMVSYIERVNQISLLPYTLGTGSKLKKEVYFNESWIKMIQDNFIPWSFVMNDELWNLMPMDSALNSSKSNKLPKWDPFFRRFASNQYILYGIIHDERKPDIRKRYESCYRDNLHSIWANQELYRKGNSKEEFYHILEKNMQPVYDSARRQGYQIW